MTGKEKEDKDEHPSGSYERGRDNIIDKSKELTVGRGINIGPSGLMAAADYIRKKIYGFNISLPSGNRLERAKKLIEDVNAKRRNISQNNKRLINLVNEAHWTIIEQYIITRALGNPSQGLSPLLYRKVKEIFSGADLPETDSNPLARNTQFELYVGALFAMGGVPVTLAEPDLVFNYLGRPCGLAAKRVSSFRKATRRAKEAADQILASGIEGVVVINTDVLLKISPESPDTTATLAERLRVVVDVENIMAGRDKVIATMTIGRDCIWNFSTDRPHANISHLVRFIVHSKIPEEEARGNEFFKKMMKGIEEQIQTL